MRDSPPIPQLCPFTCTVALGSGNRISDLGPRVPTGVKLPDREPGTQLCTHVPRLNTDKW